MTIQFYFPSPFRHSLQLEFSGVKPSSATYEDKVRFQTALKRKLGWLPPEEEHEKGL